jgi:hypothetical protein
VRFLLRGRELGHRIIVAPITAAARVVVNDVHHVALMGFARVHGMLNFGARASRGGVFQEVVEGGRDVVNHPNEQRVR